MMENEPFVGQQLVQKETNIRASVWEKIVISADGSLKNLYSVAGRGVLLTAAQIREQYYEVIPE